MKNDVFWFTHDANATDDEKIMMLIDQLGLEGYGIYWVLIEKLRGTDNFKLSFTIVPILARRYNTTAEKMLTVIKQYNLFQYDDEGFFFSPSLINRMQKWIDKKEKNSIAGKISAQKRLLLSSKNNEIEQTFNTCSTSVQLEENRIEENNTEQYKENIKKEKVFNFKKALIDLGVEEQIVNDWLIVRKNKKAANTLTAFNIIKKQIELTNSSANDCIKMAVGHSWQGFKAKWYNNETNSFGISKYNADDYISDDKDYIRFRTWMKENCPICDSEDNFNISRITSSEFIKLKEKFSGQEIADTILAIENRKDLIGKYSSLYITVNNWLKNKNK